MKMALHPWCHTASSRISKSGIEHSVYFSTPKRIIFLKTPISTFTIFRQKRVPDSEAGRRQKTQSARMLTIAPVPSVTGIINYPGIINLSPISPSVRPTPLRGARGVSSPLYTKQNRSTLGCQEWRSNSRIGEFVRFLFCYLSSRFGRNSGELGFNLF